MITYTPEKKIILSLKEKHISKGYFEKNIKNVFYYGEKKENPTISLIIVAYNEGDDLIRNLDCWEKQTNQDFELILVDNGLDDKTVEKVKKYHAVHIMCNENMGCCGGRNIGAVWARGKILVFGDADGYNPNDYIENVLQIMANEKVIAVRGRVAPINESLQEEFMPMHYDLGKERIVSLMNTEGNSAWRKEIYIRAGGFEETLAGGEGLVLQYRMVEFFNVKKSAFIYDSKMILFHDYHQNKEKLMYKIKQNIIVNSQLNLKYPFLGYMIDYYQKPRKNNLQKLKKNHSHMVKSNINKIQKIISDKINVINEEKITRRRKSGLLCCDEKKINFSVIIPCYNLGNLLPKAIDSVFAQTLENIELIVVDDQSQEKETKDILSKLEQEQKVKVIRLEKNSGVSVARNTGIKKSKGKYILCLDADDYIEPTYLEKAFNVFESDEEVVVVSCWLKTFGIFIQEWKPKDKMSIKNALLSSPVHTASCFRKVDWEKGGIYDPELRGYEDWDHWIRLMKIRPVVRVIPEFLFNYHVRRGSKVETSNRNSVRLLSRIIENHKKLYDENYAYVIVHQYEQLANNINNSRLQDEKKQNGLMAVCYFLSKPVTYERLKHGFVFIFLNPRKAIRKLRKK